MASRYADENGVFRNKLGITDASELKAVEYSLTARRMAELESGRATLNVEGFGLPRLQAIHGHLFQDVYDWAGQVRTIPSSKRAENGMVSVFEEPDRIQPGWTALEEKTNAFAVATGLSIEQKREQLMLLFVDANRLHPFPEGNGRSTQTFMRQLAGTQGLELDFTRTNQRDWNLASALSGTHGHLFERTYLIKQPEDLAPIRKVFDGIARPALAVAFEKLPEEQATARFPELRGAFTGLRAIEQRARATMGAEPERVAGYMHDVRQAFIKRLDEGKPIELTRQQPTLVRDQSKERDR